MPPATQKRPSPNMDRIVNIYSINSSKKVQKKKFYLNMGQPPGSIPKEPGANDDIRVKLR